MRYQSQEFKVPANTAGLKSTGFKLDRQFTRITGVALYEHSNGGVAGYDVALKDQHGNYLHYPTAKTDWEPITGIRYKPLDIENTGQEFTLDVKPSESPGTDIKFQLVFKLEN